MDLLRHFMFSTAIFFIGLLGITLNRRNILLLLMSIEVMLLAVNLNLTQFSVSLDNINGQIFTLFVLTVAAAESAIGLAILVIYYRVRGTLSIEFIHLLKG
jgi:NADH:ubiquinone oxidoreductase subunit K